MRAIIWVVAISITILVLYVLQQLIEKKVSAENEILKNEVLMASAAYTINDPDHTLFLSSKLKEISGLSNSTMDSVLLTVQDEKGIIYKVDKKTGAILSEEKFSGKGDYEGIELVDDTTYIVTSKGNIYAFFDHRDNTIKFETPLSIQQDIEGLGYAHHLNALLLACKARDRDQEKHLRSIYAFDLGKKELIADPLFTLDGNEIAAKLGRKKSTPYFSPSAIAITADQDIYILSSVAKALIIVDGTGRLKRAVNLDRALHSQPEGILVDDDKTLYISNEGRDGIAKIYVFNPKPK